MYRIKEYIDDYKQRIATISKEELKTLYYGFGYDKSLCIPKEDLEESISLVDTLESHYNSVVRGYKGTICDRYLEKLVEKLNLLLPIKFGSKRGTSSVVDTSQQEDYILSRTGCIPYETWEQELHRVAKKLDINFTVIKPSHYEKVCRSTGLQLSVEELYCNLILDLKSESLKDKCDTILLELEKQAQTCALDVSLNITKLQCIAEFNILVEEVRCAFSIETTVEAKSCVMNFDVYSELRSCGVDFSLIKEVYCSGLTMDVIANSPCVLIGSDIYPLELIIIKDKPCLKSII